MRKVGWREWGEWWSEVVVRDGRGTANSIIIWAEATVWVTTQRHVQHDARPLMHKNHILSTHPDLPQASDGSGSPFLTCMSGQFVMFLVPSRHVFSQDDLILSTIHSTFWYMGEHFLSLLKSVHFASYQTFCEKNTLLSAVHSWTCVHMQIYISRLCTHTHTHFMACGITLGSTGAVETDRPQEKARLDQSAAVEYKSHQPDRQIVFQKSQILLDGEQAPGDATCLITRRTSWTSSLLCSYDRSETDEA